MCSKGRFSTFFRGRHGPECVLPAQKGQTRGMFGEGLPAHRLVRPKQSGELLLRPLPQVGDDFQKGRDEGDLHRS